MRSGETVRRSAAALRKASCRSWADGVAGCGARPRPARSGCGGGAIVAAPGAVDAVGRFSVPLKSLLTRAVSISCRRRCSSALKPGLGMVRQRLAAILRAEDGTAEVAGQRRAKLRHTAVVAGQARQAVGGRPVFGRIEFFGGLAAVARLKGVDQRSAQAHARHETDAGEHLARQPRNARSLRTKPHRGGRVGGRPGQRRVLILFPGFRLAHDAGLPSVRVIRTRFWWSPAPKRSSAAANRRSTIM